MLNSLKKHSLYFAWLISLIGTLSALYASEILQWPVCNLCWYQRICLFPLAIILGIACFREDREIARYTLPLTIIGALFALYQYLEQMIPGFSPINVCGLGPSCADTQMKLFGFITFAFLSLCSFIATTIFLALSRK